MKGAFGALRWTPETFWRSTLTEYITAIKAFNEMQEGGKDTEPPTEGEMADLLARYG